MEYKLEILEKDVWKEHPFCIHPINDNDSLDTSLDNGEIILSNINRKEEYDPLTKIKLIISDGTNTQVIRRYVDTDKTEQTISGTYPRWTHTISTIEPSKILEGDIVDSVTITNPLLINYANYTRETEAVFIQKTGRGYDASRWKPSTPIMLNDSLLIKSMSDIYWIIDGNYNITSQDNPLITLPNGQNVSIAPNTNYQFTMEGIYQITYTGKVRVNDYPIKTYDVQFVYFIPVVLNTESYSKKTISDVLKKIINITPTRLNDGGDTKYKLDPNLLTITDKIISPEFSFTKQTLWETLLEIGGFIHAIPRLISDENENWNVITYDFLGGSEEYINSLISVYSSSTLSVNEYCTEIDSNVENLLNFTNINEGSTVEPSNRFYITSRTEEGNVEINNDNCFIPTNKPIGVINKLEFIVYTTNGNQNLSGDITQYVYEASEYRVLSSYMLGFPYSKAYALKYTQGQKNITNLQSKLENPISPAFELPAIINIIQRETGFRINATEIVKIRYRINYVPYLKVRVKQKKIDVFEERNKRTLIYNQNVNIADNVNYGENMKGAVLRLGNSDKQETYITSSLSNFPKLGQKRNDYYITNINKLMYKSYIRYTLELSKHFNRLNKFIGINSMPRYYEISEKQAVERDIVYSENLVIGDKIENNSGMRLFQYGGQAQFRQTLDNNADMKGLYTSFALCTTYDKNGALLKTVGLPICCSAYGNSLSFNFGFEDNYSSGAKAVSTNLFGNKKIQDYVPYSNSFGEFEYLCFSLTDVRMANNVDGEAFGDMLPEVDLNNIFDGFSTATVSTVPFDAVKQPSIQNALIVDKGNRDIPSINIQLDVVRNNPNVVIGFYLLHNNKLVNSNQNESNNVNVYLLPYKVGLFDKEIDLSNARLVASLSDSNYFTVDMENNEFQLSSFSTYNGCESFALADSDGKLYMAYNKSYGANSYTDPIYFSFTKT